MVKLAEQAHETLAQKLDPGEELRSIGHFLRTGNSLVTIFLQEFWPYALKHYFIGVTNKRLIIVRLNTQGKPIEEDNYRIPLSDVKVKNTALLIKLPGEEKPVTFGMSFGIEKLTGMNIKEFLAALGAG